MPRRHEDHQPVNLAPLDRLELLADALVMLGRLVLRVGVTSEAEKAAPRLRRPYLL